jgi:Tfp pilus assembly protein FimT
METLLACSLLGAVVCLGAVSFQRLVPKYRLKSAAWEVRSRLAYARTRSVFDGTPVRLRFEEQGYSIERFDGAANQWKDLEKSRLEGVSIRANNTPTFYPQGTVSDLATILVSNPEGTYRITLAISGKVTVRRL